jgi:acyl-CoA synthetase (AMP-forming)/AMP-acid ligase II
VSGSLLFVLADGRSALVAAGSARLICDRLWDQGIEPGATTAAARLSEVLHKNPAFDRDVEFNECEITPLMEAAQAHAPTWMTLVEASDLSLIPPAQRERLVAACAELIARLDADLDQDKVRALIVDLERLRDTLRTTGRPRGVSVRHADR